MAKFQKSEKQENPLIPLELVQPLAPLADKAVAEETPEVADLTSQIEVDPPVVLHTIPSLSRENLQAWVDQGNTLTDCAEGICLVEFKAGETRTFCDCNGRVLDAPEDFTNFGEAVALTFQRTFQFKNGLLCIYGNSGDLRVIGATAVEVAGGL